MSELENELKNLNNDFEENGYVLTNECISQDLNLYLRYCVKLHEQLFKTSVNMFTPCVGDYPKELPSSAFSEVLLMVFKDLMVKITGKELQPTFSSVKIFGQDNEILPHTSNPECEYTALLTLKKDKETTWSCKLNNLVNGSSSTFFPDINDILILRGDEVLLSYNKLEASDHVTQIYLHFVDINGKYAEHAFNQQNKKNQK